MSELKPCPFCGGEAETHEVGFPYHYWEVYCDGECFDHFCEKPTEAEAIAAWNTRAERTCRMEWDEDSEGDELYPVGHVTCSACGAWLYAVNTMRFCPNCGAKVVSE